MRARGRSGSAAIEFALILPVFLLMLFGIIEVGVSHYFAGSLLQSATDTVAREIRTGQISGTLSATDLVADICTGMTGLLSQADCQANLQVDLRSYDSFPDSTPPYTGVTKPDGSIDTSSLTVQSAGACEVVLLRAFYPWSIMTPLLAPLMSNMPNGQYLLTAASAFRNEPYTSGASC